jgi:hypothetical protein
MLSISATARVIVFSSLYAGISIDSLMSGAHATANSPSSPADCGLSKNTLPRQRADQSARLIKIHLDTSQG